MNNPLVSVIIPVFNAASFICKCIDSTLDQTYKNIEIILINDGSTDSSEAIIKENYGSEDRIKYYCKDNEGVSKARNIGIEKSCGDYITFVDSDDWIQLNFIEVAMEVILKNNLDFVLGGTEKVHLDYTEKYTSKNSRETVIYENDLRIFTKKVLSNGIVGEEKLDACFTSGSVCKVFSRKVIGNIRFKEQLVVGEDSIFNLEVLNNTKRAGVVSQIWYYYRMHDACATKNYNPQIVEHTEKLVKVFYAMYSNNDEYKPFLVARYIQQFHGMLILFPLNQSSNMRIYQQCQFIRNCLNKEVWSVLLEKENLKSLPSKMFDKVMLKFCITRNSLGIVLLVKARLSMKTILRKLD